MYVCVYICTIYRKTSEKKVEKNIIHIHIHIHIYIYTYIYIYIYIDIYKYIYVNRIGEGINNPSKTIT